MTTETAERRRVAIVDGARRLDLVVPATASVAEALAAAGATPAPRQVVLETGGRQIEPSTRVDQLRDGAILVLVDLAASATPGRRRRSRSRDQPLASTWWVVGAAGVVLAISVLAFPGGLDRRVQLAVGAASVVAATLAGVVLAARAAPRGGSRLAAVAGILALAFAGAAACVPPVPAGVTLLAVFCGLLFASALAGALGVVSRSGTLRAEARTAMVLLLVLAAVWGLCLLMHLGVESAAAITVGLAPVAHRVLLASLVDVAPGTFIDYARFQTTRWTVRQQLPDEVQSIGADDAGALVARSTARLAAGTLLLVVAAVASAPVAIPTFDTPDPLVLAGRIALAATSVLALLLSARKTTVPPVRWMLRLGATGIVAAALVAVVRVAPDAVLALVAVGCLVAGAASALLVVPVGRGVRSLGWSRFADVVEWLAIALSLPAALLAAGAVEAVRGMMAA